VITYSKFYCGKKIEQTKEITRVIFKCNGTKIFVCSSRIMKVWMKSILEYDFLQKYGRDLGNIKKRLWFRLIKWLYLQRKMSIKLEQIIPTNKLLFMMRLS
jgi:hypothetical protein